MLLVIQIYVIAQHKNNCRMWNISTVWVAWQQEGGSLYQQIGPKFKEETSKVLHLEHSFVWCWRKTEISWTDRVKNKEALKRVKEERNIFHTIKRKKTNWIGHILCRNCLLKHVNEGKIEGTERRGRRRKQLMDNLKKTRESWNFKEEPLDRTLWRTCFARHHVPVVRQTTEWRQHRRSINNALLKKASLGFIPFFLCGVKTVGTRSLRKWMCYTTCFEKRFGN